MFKKLKHIIDWICNIGCYSDLTIQQKIRVREINVHAFTTILLLLPQPFIIYYIFPERLFWLLITFVLFAELGNFYLNKIRFYKSATVFSAIIASACITYFSMIFGYQSNMHLMQIAIFITIILNYSKNDGRFYLYFATIPIISIAIISLTSLGTDYAIELNQSDFMILHNLSLLNTIFTILIYSFLYVRRNSKLFENLNESKERTVNENEELRIQNNELDKFVYYTSHDLKSPLATLKGLISLSQGESDIKKIKEYLFLQERSVNKLTNFVNDLIDSTKNKRGELNFVEIDVETEIKYLLENLIFGEDKSQIVVSIDIVQQSKLVTDKNSFYLIVNNLLSNAIRYQKPNAKEKRINITGVINEREARLNFFDTGIGISEESIDKIFNMFYRATSIKDGTGLGLYIVSELINKLKGKISVSSTLGSFTSFDVILPNHQTESEVAKIEKDEKYYVYN